MKLSGISTGTLRAWLMVLGPVFPALAGRVRDELAAREVDAKERRSKVWAAARAQADLRAEGFSAWIGLGGDA